MTNFHFVKKSNLQFIQYNLGDGVNAFTTTRHGLGPSGCNLYKNWHLEEGRQSFRRVCAALSVSPENMATNRLLDSTNIVRRVDAPEADIYDEPSIIHADGLVTDVRGLVLYLYASDCALIFMYDPAHHAIGFCHAGWRGTVRGVIENTIQAMAESYGARPSDLIVAISPLVSQPFCGLTPDEASEFNKVGLAHFITHEPGRYILLRSTRNDQSPFPNTIPDYYADLLGADLEILAKSGVSPNHIMATGLCTYTHSDLFHSYFRGPIDATGYHRTGVNGSFFWLA